MLVEKLVPSPLGDLRLVATSDALVAIWLPEQRARREGASGTNDLLEQAAAELGEWFRGERRAFSVPIAPEGTAFQREVWAALRTIPYGVRWSYAELARAIGRPSAVRAVGAANGRNPLSIVVPCHRVVGSDGALTGYAGGLDAKRWLLTHEAASA